MTEKFALVTGGTKGIGKQICIDLLAAGYTVFTNYGHDDSQAELARISFSEKSSNFYIIKADQASNNEMESYIHFIRQKTQVLHCIVFNTGMTLRNRLNEIENQDWEKVFKVNLHSHVYLIRDLNDLLVRKSKLIFIGSVLGEIPHSSSIVYGVTKAAIHSLAKNLVKEFSEREITVNTIAPGFVETDWQADKAEDIRTRICAKTALKRFATVAEVSKVCSAILENDFINGSTLVVDGGYDYK